MVMIVIDNISFIACMRRMSTFIFVCNLFQLVVACDPYVVTQLERERESPMRAREGERKRERENHIDKGRERGRGEVGD